MKHLLLWSLLSLSLLNLSNNYVLAQPRINTNPVGADDPNINMSGEDKLLSKTELGQRIEQFLDNPKYSNWKMSRRGDTYVVHCPNVQVIDRIIELPLNLSEAEEQRQLKKKGFRSTTYNITLSFERFSKEKFIPNKVHNESVKQKILDLESSLLYDMNKDDKEKTRYASTKNQKDRLVDYWTKRTDLETTYVENPEYFVMQGGIGYQVNINYPYFDRIYPAKAGTNAKEIYDHIKLLLYGDYSLAEQ